LLNSLVHAAPDLQTDRAARNRDDGLVSMVSMVSAASIDVGFQHRLLDGEGRRNNTAPSGAARGVIFSQNELVPKDETLSNY
jgi:hypothetical protein